MVIKAYPIHITSMEFLAFRPKFVPLDDALLCFFWRENWAVGRRKWGHPYLKHDSKCLAAANVHFLRALSTVFWGRQLEPQGSSTYILGGFCARVPKLEYWPSLWLCFLVHFLHTVLGTFGGSSFGLYCYFLHISTISSVGLEQKVLPPL